MHSSEVWPEAPLIVNGKYGVLQFTLPASNAKINERLYETTKKLFLSKLLQEMHSLGYDILESSNLTK